VALPEGGTADESPHLLLTLALGLGASVAPAQESGSKLPPSEDLQGSPLYHVLPKDEIPAIYEPQFVSGEEAKAQMIPHEPVLGVFDGTHARAYSLWQLDHHEVVDDMLGEVPIAATRPGPGWQDGPEIDRSVQRASGSRIDRDLPNVRERDRVLRAPSPRCGAVAR
jgi:hypothetical protein